MKNKNFVGGYRRLFSRKYVVKESEIKRSHNHHVKTGKIVIESESLKDFAGKTVKIIIYVPRSSY